MKDVLKNVLAQLNEIKYGWVDKYGIVHKKARKDFFLQNYRLQSIDETLKYKVGTCWEQVELVRYLLEKENIQCKTYIIIYNDNNVIARHTIAVVNSNKNSSENKTETDYKNINESKNNKYYLMESSWNMELKTFDSIDEILKMFIKMYPSMYKIKDFDVNKIEIFEYTKPEEHLNYNEFTEFCRRGKGVKLNNIR